MMFHFTCVCDCAYYINFSSQLHEFQVGDEFWAEVSYSNMCSSIGEIWYSIIKHNKSGHTTEEYYMTADELSDYFKIEVVLPRFMSDISKIAAV